MYLKGNFKKYIFRGDNNYVIGLFKVSEALDSAYVNKTITFTGYFAPLNENDLYKLEGDFVTHHKYGIQFNTTSYEVLLPSDRDNVIEFLSSDLFKGIGKRKASLIVDTLGDDALSVILEDKSVLYDIKSLKMEQCDLIYDTLVSYKSSYEKVMRLIGIGFSMKDALRINDFYDSNFVFLDNPYQMINDIKEITFSKIEKIRDKLGISFDDINRVSEGIIYVMNELSFRSGDVYHNYNNILKYSSRLLGVSSDVISLGLSNLVKENRVLIDDDKYYLRTLYNSEMYIARRISLFTDSFSNNNYDKYIEEIESEYSFSFNEDQRKALVNSFNHRISIVTGGPGTGKTTIIKAMVRLYQKIHGTRESELEKEVCLLAPTGRASKRMSFLANFPSYTIHRFLKWQKEEDSFLVNEDNKSDVKFVIVDEVSMLDMNLFYNLLLGLNANVRIVLIGDYNQLPSVGCGQILKDLILSDVVPVTYLKKLYRQDGDSNINLLAEDIINNRFDFSLFNKSDDLTFVSCSESDLKDVLRDFIVTYKDMSIYNFQVLCPIYKGNNGIDGLNNFIQDIVNGKDSLKNEVLHDGFLYREGDKVLHLVNNIDDNVFNGDIGEVIRVESGKKGKSIIIDFDNNIVRYGLSNFDNFRLGYTVSVHKAQGSEFDVVIIPILSSYGSMLYKKLIYTGITRAKKRLILLGDADALKRGILRDRDDDRNTSLKDFLISCINDKK